LNSQTARQRLLVSAALALEALLLAACGGAMSAESTDVPPLTDGEQVVVDLGLHGTALGPLERPDFVLTDTEGAIYDFRAETSGGVTLLYFGYTNCPDVCPVHFSNIAAAMKQAPSEVRRGVTVVFVGVDAPRDTADQMRAWLDFFDADFIGLTGTEEQLEVAQIAAAAPPAFIDAEFEGGYSVAHSGWLFLYTQDDLMHLRYPAGVRQSGWAHDLELLVRDGWPAE
jgi:protein SCO1/2